MKPAQTQAGLTKRNDPILGRKRNKGRLRTTQPQTHHTTLQRAGELWRALALGVGLCLSRVLGFIRGPTRPHSWQLKTMSTPP